MSSKRANEKIGYLVTENLRMDNLVRQLTRDNAIRIERLRNCEEALIAMVQQYCYRPLDANKEPAVDVYQHDFMSAGEETFEYLVQHGLAKWTDDKRYAIEFVMDETCYE